MNGKRTCCICGKQGHTASLHFPAKNQNVMNKRNFGGMTPGMQAEIVAFNAELRKRLLEK